MPSDRRVRPFDLRAPFAPAGDQPAAIDALVAAIERGERYVTLHGVTGTGKSFTLASVIARLNRPTVVLAPNKALAAQLYSEFTGFFPTGAVEYFVSYYDYYQPEAYVAASDTFIDKESMRNDDLDRLRHSATASALTRTDVCVVCSVSAIYGLGSPEAYSAALVSLEVGDELDVTALAHRLVALGYERNDVALERNRFRVRGDTITLWPAYTTLPLRLEFFGDALEKISEIDPTTAAVVRDIDIASIFPATHYLAGVDAGDQTGLHDACAQIEAELQNRLEEFHAQGKLLEAQRLEQRTRNDLDLLRETRWCAGIENYSRFFDNRAPGSPPSTFFDYLPDDLLVIIDESHVAVPQLSAAHAGDRSRKQNLVDYGFRLPSALDNRPLTFAEVNELVARKRASVIFSSATPGPFEREHSQTIVHQELRPTGLLDPECVVKPSAGQVDDLIAEINQTVTSGARVLVTTLTKKMAEALCDYLLGANIKVRYLHSDIETLERVALLDGLRAGEFDVLVGINLLREGLDLPEVALVAILDADKEGFLRSYTALVQTIGRAARNSNGRVILYADKTTPAMRQALQDTARRRRRQARHNARHNITPTTTTRHDSALAARLDPVADISLTANPPSDPAEIADLMESLTVQMAAAAADLRFEEAARLRDQLRALSQA